MEAAGGSAASDSFLSRQPVLLAVAAIVAGSLIAVFWSFFSNSAEDKSRKDKSPEKSSGSSKGKTKALAKQLASQPKASPKASVAKEVKAKAQTPAPAAPAAPAAAAVLSGGSDVEMSDGPCTSGGEAPQETSPEKKKKKKRKPAKAEADEEEEAAAAAGGEDAAEEIEEDEKIGGAELGLDGWTSVATQKKKAPDAEAEEKNEKAKERDKKKAEKISDLRRRKAGINQQLQKLEDGLNSGSGSARPEEQVKVLEARSRLQLDLEKVNASIHRLTHPSDGRGAGDAHAAADEGADADANGAWEGYAYEGDQQWDQWDEWTGATDWSSSWDTGRWGKGGKGKGSPKAWGKGSPKGKGKGRGYSWEEEAGGFAGEDWQEADWYEAAEAPTSASKWVVKGSEEATKRQKEKSSRSPKVNQWAGAWWEDASWDSTAAEPSASSWAGAQNGAEGGEWTEDAEKQGNQDDSTTSKGKRERKAKGEGKGEGKGKSEGKGKANRRDRESGDRGQDGREASAPQEAADGDEAVSQSPPRSPGEEKGSRRERKGKGKGKEGKDGDSWEDSKGKDSKGKGKGKKGKNGKDDRGNETANMEDWLKQRLGVKKQAEEEDTKAPEQQDERTPGGAESLRKAIAPLFGAKGERPNWGDAESSDEDRPAAVARPGRPAHLTAALKKNAAAETMRAAGAAARDKVRESKEPEGSGADGSAPKAVAEDGKWGAELEGFLGEDALKDSAKFEEQLKYAPTWVRDKALRRRKQLMRPTDS